MQDEITELKATEVEHERKTTAQLETFRRQMYDMQMTLAGQQAAVDGFTD